MTTTDCAHNETKGPESELPDDNDTDDAIINENDIHATKDTRPCVHIHERIGVGGSAFVFRGCHDDADVAVKAFFKNWVSERTGKRMDMREKGRKEARIMTAIPEHRHVCQVLGSSEGTMRDGGENFFIVIAYASHGDLLTRIKSTGAMNEREACRIFGQIASAVKHLHDNNFVHRDLKPENVLLDDKDEVMLCDFGFASTWTPGEKLEEYVGTLNYASPEVIGHTPYTGPELDVWSLGTVLLAMLTARMPFEAPTDEEVANNIRDAAFRMPRGVSAVAKDLLMLMLNPDPEKRPTIDDVILHPWMSLKDEDKKNKKQVLKKQIAMMHRPLSSDEDAYSTDDEEDDEDDNDDGDDDDDWHRSTPSWP